jgi:hypothetical protein
MRIQRLFVIDWIPDHTPGPESLAVRSGLGVKPAKKGIRFDCICPDEDALDRQSFSDNSATFPMWLCDGSSRIVPCGRTMCDSLIGQRFETPEETVSRWRASAISICANRLKFDLHQEFPVSPRRVFLDRDEPGDNFCRPVQVELSVGTYAELPDYVAQKSLIRFLRDAAQQTTIESPAWLPVEVSTENDCERTLGVLELVSARPEGARRFDARIYTLRALRLSAGDFCTRKVRWTADGRESHESIRICRVV